MVGTPTSAALGTGVQGRGAVTQARRLALQRPGGAGIQVGGYECN